MVNRINISLDGPSGAGKSTMAKAIANLFNLRYLDTGAIYRTVALFAIQNGVNTEDKEKVRGLLNHIELSITFDHTGQQRMILNGHDVSEDIRMPEVSLAAANVSAMPPVRDFLLSMQRKFALEHDTVMDGRDIGTVVLPNATIKIFLTANSEARAERRYNELIEKGVETSYEEVYDDLIYRDKKDESRKTAPLKAAPDAIVVDTSKLSLEESINLLKAIIKEKIPHEGSL